MEHVTRNIHNKKDTKHGRHLFHVLCYMFHEGSGQSLIELLVAIGLTTILIPAVLTGLVASRNGKAQEGQRMEASTLLIEAQEAVRTVREKGWQQFPGSGTYYPQIAGTSWSLVAGAQSINGYQRSIVISDVQRDGTGAIVDSGGTVDTSTKKIDITVSWTTPQNGSVTSTSYISRYLGNAAKIDTTQAQFNAGSLITTQTTNTAGGEVQLLPWSQPSNPTLVDFNGNEDANKLVVSGNFAFVGTQVRAGTGEFLVVDVTTNTVVANLEFGENVTDMAIQGNYVYVLTSNSNARLRIIDVTTPTSPVAVGSPLSMGVTVNGGSIAVSGNYAYIGTLSNSRQEFYIVNVTNASAPSITGKLEIGANVTGIAVNGNYAYLATSQTIGQLKVVNVSNPAAPGAPISYTNGSGRGALSIFYDSNTIYQGVSSGAGADFYIINVTNPLAPSALGSLDTSGPVNGIYEINGIAFIATTVATKQGQIINVINKSAPTLISSINLAGNANDVYFSGNKIFFADAANTGEFQIVNPGGTSGFHGSGAFESATMDAGSSVAFNSVNFTVTNSQANPLGNNHIGASVDSSDSNFINSSRFTMGPTSRTVASMSVYVASIDAAPNNQFETGIYTDNAGVPGTLVAKSSRGTLTANSWNTVPISATLNANQSYWLGYNTNGTNSAVNNMRMDPSGQTAWTSNGQPFGTWPTNFGPATTATGQFSIYATFDNAGSGAQLTLQVATNNDNATWNYVGTDGTANTSFTASGPIPLSIINGRYIRYKATLTGDGTITPILNDVTVNYSP